MQNLNNISKHYFAVCREGSLSYSPTSHHVSEHFSHPPLRPWKKEDLSITRQRWPLVLPSSLAVVPDLTLSATKISPECAAFTIPLSRYTPLSPITTFTLLTSLVPTIGSSPQPDTSQGLLTSGQLYHDPKNAAWSPASPLNTRDSEQQTATVPGNLHYRAGVPNNARNAEGSTTREELHLHQIDAGNGGKEGTAVCGGCGPQGAEEVPAPSFFVCSY